MSTSLGNHYFLTGGTGGLGRELIPRLLADDPSARLTILIRAAGPDHMRRRLEATLRYVRHFYPGFYADRLDAVGQQERARGRDGGGEQQQREAAHHARGGHGRGQRQHADSHVCIGEVGHAADNRGAAFLRRRGRRGRGAETARLEFPRSISVSNFRSTTRMRSSRA